MHFQICKKKTKQKNKKNTHKKICRKQFCKHVNIYLKVHTVKPVHVVTSTLVVATSADSVPSSYLVRITIAHIGTTFGNLQ